MHCHGRVSHPGNVNRVMLDGAHLVVVHLQVRLPHNRTPRSVFIFDDVSRASLESQTGKVYNQKCQLMQ